MALTFSGPIEGFRPRPFSILVRGLRSTAGKALPPKQNAGAADTNGPGDGSIWDPLSGHQDHARSEGQTLRCTRRAAPSFEHSALVFGDGERRRRCPHRDSLHGPSSLVNLFLGRYTSRSSDPPRVSWPRVPP